ncbi:hypothetical protein MIND_00424400 [Mycena indigotica]|uniref:HCP-like protein n=1 Tax=Mycena indigotica TaxID=2126181 RepID=A0A8H6W650_9AGAR|nr:uncharacterized protein MIND_00424400 [Mycena indigotica]KAF7306332.1 hypothetical protein MIND_00424400 [Mycena indigotica]
MMAAAPQQSFQFPHSSPLDTLVRKTSARRAPSSREDFNAAREERRHPPPISTERQPYQSHHTAPSSPLLHSQFNRQSTATWGDGLSNFDNNSSYLDLSKDSDPPEIDYGSYDTPDTHLYQPESHLFQPPALRDSWQSSSTGQRALDESDWPAVPIVTVSAPVSGYAAGKTAIINPTSSNYSRPARPAVELPEAYEDEQKKRVLERNGRKAAPNTPDNQGFQRSPLSRAASTSSSVYSRESVATIRQEPEPPRPPITPGGSGPIALPRRPPSPRNSSPVSLYSDYSFYQLDSATPSPTDKQFKPRSPSALQQQHREPSQEPPSRHVAFATSAPQPSSSPTMRTAQEFLQLGITHHENDRLAESAVCFERAATLDGGCGVGMLMWGLALRHGWGCTKNEKHGFKWLRRAAEHAVSDLEAARQGGAIDESAIQTELILAIYEVGQCFFHGWGIPKDAKMGVSYYTVAARMGDADAQMDLGFCLANGKGTKKDRKEAAKWYRAAVKQGQSDIGLAWIYKEKFQ